MNKHTAELLEKHFDTAFAAPDGIKKLRELILTLAMQGKLVPQDPNEQPASDLLQEIEAEKQRLVKEGQIKKPKPLPPVAEEEKPYALPQGWEWVRLRDICHDWGQRVPNSRFTYIDVSAIDNKSGRIAEAQIIGASDAPSRARKIVHPGDVVYSTVRPYLLNVAIIEREYEPEPIASTAFAVLHSYNGVLNRFVFRYLRSPIFISYVERTQKGVAYPAINDGDFFSGLFPLPPSDEQHRIVAKIDELMARCDELEKLRTAQQGARLTVHAAAIKQLLNITEPAQHHRAQAFLAEHFGELYTVKENVAELRKAILQLAVMGKLVPQNPNDQPASELLRKINTVKRTLEEKEGLRTSAAPFVSQSEEIYGKPEGWSYCRLGNIGKFIDYRGKTPTKVEIGVPLITAKNVRFGYINREPKEYLTPEEYIRWMTRGFPRVGDILFTTEAPLGNVAIIDIEEKFALAQRVICLQLHMPEIATWLKNFMMSDSFQERLLLEATGMTATGIKASKLKEMPVPIPPLEEQYRIVAKVDQVMALCDSLDQHIDAAITKQAELLSAVVAQV